MICPIADCNKNLRSGSDFALHVHLVYDHTHRELTELIMGFKEEILAAKKKKEKDIRDYEARKRSTA